MPELNLNWVHSTSMGYGRFGTNLAGALTELGLDVYDAMPTPAEARFSHEENPGARSKHCHVVAWASTPTHARGWWSDQYPVIWTMWESGSLPESFRETLHHFAKVIVPSHQNLELFSRYHPDVSFVPLGIDPKVWYPTERPEVGATFRFLIGGSGPRKGTDLAVKAFRAAFPTVPEGGPTPVLIMKNPRTEPFYGPNIEVIGGKLSDEDEVALYASAHCYLQPSRGEGFGLQPLQAMAQGCPTILTAAHGHDAFAHLGIGIPAKRVESAYFLFGDAGKWWEPDFDALVEQMRWVYGNYDEATFLAAGSALVVAWEFTWERTAKAFLAAVGPERFEIPGDSTAAWFKPDQRLYRLVTLRDWRCDIAGLSYYFEKGREHFELADTKRILFEAGVLDPVCLDEDDTGLAPSQVEQLGAYRAKHSWCQSCGQQLGTKPTRADVIEEELRVSTS